MAAASQDKIDSTQ